MKRISYWGIAFLLIPTAAVAGQIYGSVTNGPSPAARVGIEIACGGAVTRAITSGDGSYRAAVPQEGRCIFTIPSLPGRPSAAIFSYPKPAQYDFELVHRGDGGYDLRRH